mmetsp:Transcript_168357/g.298316  ORF Transcript_168357/g.298316 Transcript_168357/m.298316 type:complete len:558 (+) Transcript_168357:57-1730(+)
MVNKIDEPWEYFLVFLVLAGMLAAILVPFVHYLKPSPRTYYRFFQKARNVYVIQDGKKRFRWMPHYFCAVGTSFFIGQAVFSTLHYPLLFTFGASMTQICVLDACSGFLAAVIDFMLRSGPWGKLSRKSAFLIAASLNAIGYTVIIGFIMPMLSNDWFWAQLFAVFVTQTLAGLNLTVQEFAVMRNDWREDVVSEMEGNDQVTLTSFCGDISTSERYGLKLGHLSMLCRYLATIVANLIFGQYVNRKSHICSSYIFLGLLSAVHGIWLAWAWRKHVPRKHIQEDVDIKQDVAAEEEESRLLKGPLADLRPGGQYFRMALSISFYNGGVEVVRKGYVRLLNLCVLQSHSIADDDLSLLLTITFSISCVFFWLADTASHSVPDAANSVFKWIKHDDSPLTGKMLVGTVSFLLMGLGHFFMGVWYNFYGLLVSAVFFGLGQATSTGLGTVIKDDMRSLMRRHHRSEAYRNRLMRIVNGVTMGVSIASSLLVACFGNRPDIASKFYACLALGGAFLSLMNAGSLPQACLPREEMFNWAGVSESDKEDTSQPFLESRDNSEM